MKRLVLLAWLLFAAGCREEIGPSHPGLDAKPAANVTRLTPSVSFTPIPEATSAIGNPLQEADAHPQAQLKEDGDGPKPALDTDASRCGALLPLTLSAEEPLVKTIPERELPVESIPESALPALQRILSEPGSVALAAYRVGWEEDGVYLNQNAPMPLASVIKVITLIAYAEAVSAGNLDPASWVPLTDLARSYLPGMDLGSHNRALADLEERNLIGRQPLATPMEEVPWMMIRFSSNAAADYLHFAIGHETVEKTVVELGLQNHTAPCPWIGQFLSMSNHTRPATNSRAIAEYIADPDTYGLEVMELARSYVDDDDFRTEELDWRRRQPSIQIQRLFAENLNGQGTALEYANLMAQIMDNTLSSSFVNILVRRNMEWPMTFPENQEIYTYLGMKNGSLPGVLTTVYYGQRIEDGARLVVALFFRNLPMSTYRQWRRDLPHDELARWLLSDPDAISTVKDLLP